MGKQHGDLKSARVRVSLILLSSLAPLPTFPAFSFLSLRHTSLPHPSFQQTLLSFSATVLQATVNPHIHRPGTQTYGGMTVLCGVIQET